MMLRNNSIREGFQDDVAESEKLHAFGLIAAGVAHEVKNPLGGIRGAAEILASRASDSKSLDAAELIVREVDRIAALVDDLMLITHDDLRLAPMNLHRLLDNVLALASYERMAKGVAITREFDPSIPELRADADRLAQVFVNLVRNALQALEGRGALVIATWMTVDDRLHTPTDERRPMVAIEVRDTGPGIPAEIQSRLATPFFTTRPGGTGLGLALSRYWVSRHGGTLHVESAPGAGVRVRVMMPLQGSGRLGDRNDTL
ncbi:MAG: ATP-binding protein [Myxococcota bacterium]